MYTMYVVHIVLFQHKYKAYDCLKKDQDTRSNEDV